MEPQHPIPQQISSYQFRLVGDMTLKQFFQLAAGALLSLLIYASGLHPLIKWPLILFFALFGVALAFLPFEDRPLDRWVIAFFKSIYSPTEYSWQKTEKPLFFQEEAIVPQEKIVAPQGEKALEAYLQTRPDEKAGFLGKLENTETNILTRISSLFGGTPAPTTQTQTTQQVAPTPNLPPQRPIQTTPTPNIRIAPTSSRPRLVVEEQGKRPGETSQVSPLLKEEALTASQGAMFSLEAAPPMPPSQPNTVSGQVMDSEGKIIESAILEIKDVAGRPVRAIKTNKLGHFLIVTPLQNGVYEITTEKEGLNFDPVKFEATGGIIPPIAIRATNKLPPQNGQN